MKMPVAEDSELLPDLLTLSDVPRTGDHAARTAGVRRGDTAGDGAVVLSVVLSARLLGAEQIVLMGRHRTCTDRGRDFGATDVVAEHDGLAAAVSDGAAGDGGTRRSGAHCVQHKRLDRRGLRRVSAERHGPSRGPRP
ncbi:hypothetical protein GCM10022295_12810 [Streptomyces osmaniensis]|uniref:Uncharacterized protein n=1 Tax=Streptomyces osmaniensis TaxID=593134 RepID=A0ABP6VAZ1_9ACTN